jgi:hypothetical protein
MKQEFITSHGKVIIERDKIFIQRIKRDITWKAITIIFFILACFFVVISPDFTSWFHVFFWLFIAIGENFNFIKKLPRKSFKNRILISEIESTSFIHDVNGFDTNVELKLTSGKTRSLRFRKLENQYQSFIEAVSQQINLPQTAV